MHTVAPMVSVIAALRALGYFDDATSVATLDAARVLAAVRPAPARAVAVRHAAHQPLDGDQAGLLPARVGPGRYDAVAAAAFVPLVAAVTSRSGAELLIPVTGPDGTARLEDRVAAAVAAVARSSVAPGRRAVALAAGARIAYQLARVGPGWPGASAPVLDEAARDAAATAIAPGDRIEVAAAGLLPDADVRELLAGIDPVDVAALAPFVRWRLWRLARRHNHPLAGTLAGSFTGPGPVEVAVRYRVKIERGRQRRETDGTASWFVELFAGP